MAEFAQVSTDSWTGNASSTTLSAMSLGSPDSNRVLYVVLTMFHNVSTANPATLTIDGDSAISIVQAQSTGQFERCAIFVLPQSSMTNPTATSADVVVTSPASGGNMRAALVTIYRGVGYGTSASDTGTDIDNDPVSATVTFPANGIVLGSAGSNNGAADATTWTNLTEINDDLLFFQTFSQAVDSGVTSGSTAVSAAWGSETITALAVACFAVTPTAGPPVGSLMMMGVGR